MWLVEAGQVVANGAGEEAVGCQQIVAEVGYSYALAVCLRAVRNSDSVLQLPRILAAGESVQELEEKVSGGWDMVGLWHEKVAAENRKKDSIPDRNPETMWQTPSAPLIPGWLTFFGV